MNKTLIGILVGLALIASVAMFFIGKNSSHLSELYDLFWVPLPIAATGLLLLFKK